MGKIKFPPELLQLYKHPHWKYVIRPAVMRRDNYTCQDCKKQIVKGTPSLHLQVDHLLYKPWGSTLEELLQQPINQMQTLCNVCHAKKTRNERKARNAASRKAASRKAYTKASRKNTR